MSPDPNVSWTRIAKSFDFAQSALNHIFTLATAVLGLSVSLVRFIAISQEGIGLARMWIGFAWGLLIVAIALAFWGQLALAGQLGSVESSPTPVPTNELTIYNQSITVPALGAIVCFALGLALLALASLVWFEPSAILLTPMPSSPP